MSLESFLNELTYDDFATVKIVSIFLTPSRSSCFEIPNKIMLYWDLRLL